MYSDLGWDYYFGGLLTRGEGSAQSAWLDHSEQAGQGAIETQMWEQLSETKS